MRLSIRSEGRYKMRRDRLRTSLRSLPSTSHSSHLPLSTNDDYSALSPPTCYKRTFAREKISTLVLVPILILTAIVPAHYWATLVSISIGIGFFAQPLLIRAGKKFVKLVPDWREKINLRKYVPPPFLLRPLLNGSRRQLDPIWRPNRLSTRPPPPPRTRTTTLSPTSSSSCSFRQREERATPRTRHRHPRRRSHNFYRLIRRGRGRGGGGGEP
jgi:hypothetical protein